MLAARHQRRGSRPRDDQLLLLAEEVLVDGAPRMFPLAVYARCMATSTTTEIGMAAHIFCGDAVAACIASSWACSVAVTAITAMPVWNPTGRPPLTDFAHGMAWRMNSWTASPFAWGTA